MKQTIKKKQLFKEIIILTISSVIVLLSVCYTIYPINFRLINTTLNHEEWSDLIINLFTIQATIATLSISIIAIITGFQSKSVCGITVTHYVTTLKPCILKHKVLMIADLVITAINYFVVAYGGSNVSISLFIVSVIISCVLIIDTSFVFKKSEEIESEIHDFLLQNYNEEVINDLGKSIDANAIAGNENEIKFELALMNDFFQNELTNDYGSKDKLKTIESIMIKCFLNSYASNNKEIVLSILKSINDIYAYANSKSKKPYPVDIWSSIYFQYMTFIGTVALSKISDIRTFDYLEFRNQIQKNTVFEKKEDQRFQINNSLIEYYYVMFYQKMMRNNTLDGDDIERVKETLLVDAYLNAFRNNTNEDEMILDIKGICYLLKSLIEDGETELLNSHFLQRLNYTLNKPLNAFVFLTSVVYAYYLAYNEPYVNNMDEQKNAIKYLNLIRGSYSNTIDFHSALYRINLLSVFENSRLNFFSLMRNWEKFKNGVVKTIRLEPTIKECLFFISIEKYHNEEKLAKCFRLFSGNQVQPLIMNFFSNDSSFEEQYVAFRKNMFGQSIAKDDERVLATKSLVRGALAREYKIELTEQAEKQRIDDQKIQKFKEQLTALFDEQKRAFDIFVHDEFPDQIKKSISIQLPYIDYNDLENDTSSYFEQSFSKALFSAFFNTLSSDLRTLEINYQSKEKQDTLINLSSGLSPDTFIGSRETFWEEDEKDKLIHFTEGMNKMDFLGSNSELYLLNSQKIFFNISKVSFEISDCTVDDFERIGVEKQGDVYLYSRLANVMKVPYQEEELLSYLKQTRRRLVMSFEICSAVKESPVGCGIAITYEEKALEIPDNETNTREKEKLKPTSPQKQSTIESQKSLTRNPCNSKLRRKAKNRLLHYIKNIYNLLR